MCWRAVTADVGPRGWCLAHAALCTTPGATRRASAFASRPLRSQPQFDREPLYPTLRRLLGHLYPHDKSGPLPYDKIFTWDATDVKNSCALPVSIEKLSVCL